MVTFILVPTFAISAFLVGAFPAAYGAPLATYPRDSLALVNRGCHQVGCLAETSANTSDSSAATTTPAAAVATGSPASADSVDTAQEPPDSIGAVARAVGAARLYLGELSALAEEEPRANQI
ncbi:hypothetical protein GSI_04234 [Ganoderma sinense ZZ0214-1]|uniref:Transporter n=1 Tax=Ganoderma sinense ZZ0214-1 TaxID=1077348 RepID=A0A2G8SIM6_9APHY|nr:hypothetical protein GSI_04234 [Ganoderma sinense ZZ0214-1]